MEKINIYIHKEGNRALSTLEIDSSKSIIEAFAELLNDFAYQGDTKDQGHNGKDKPKEHTRAEVYVYLQDEDEPKDKKDKCEKAGITGKCHVHIHRCKKVQVRIEYNGVTKDFNVPPAISGRKLLKMAGKEFNISNVDLADFKLKVSEDLYLGPKDHVGSFVSHPNCSIDLTLEPKTRING